MLLCYNLAMLNLDAKYELRKSGFLDVTSISYLKDLYLPIISHEAFFLYLYLAEVIKDGSEISGTMKKLIVNSTLSSQSFQVAKRALESIGLINTYSKNDEDEYLIVVYDPHTPKKFLNNLVLAGLLSNSVGKEKFAKITEKYKIEKVGKEYKDVSASITDTYMISFDLEDLKSIDNEEFIGRNVNTIKTNFSDIKLLSYLKKTYQMNENALSDEELEFITGLGSLFGMKEKMIGDLVSQSYIQTLTKGSRLDKNKLKRLCQTYAKSYKVAEIKVDKKTKINSNSDWGQKINYYESISPREFLEKKQNNVSLASSDFMLLSDLMSEYKFSNGMINALIDYVLTVKDGEINANYVKKIATTLLRKDVRNTLDVINSLYKLQPTPKVEEAKQEIVQEENNVDLSSEDEISEEDIDKYIYGNI